MLKTSYRSIKKRKKKGPLKVIGWLLLTLLLLVIVVLVLAASVSLKPEVMSKLPLFEKLTVLNYSQQVQSEDIQANLQKALNDTSVWYQTVPKEKLAIESEDGYQLIAMKFTQEADNQTRRTNQNKQGHDWALILHGYTGWKEEMYEFAYWYYQEGYNVIVPDLRCQGESSGDFIGMGYTDAKDCMLWLQRILEADPDANIVLHGQSMGAATALIMSGKEELPDNVIAIISDAAYTDAYSMFSEKLKDWFHLPAFPLIDGASLMIRLRAGYSLKQAAPIEFVTKSKVPTLFIHGAEDAMISVNMAYQLYEAEAADKQLLIIEGAGHAQTQSKDPDLYYDTIRSFIAPYKK